MKKNSKNIQTFYWIGALLLLLYMALNIINGRFQMYDLWVYYDALEHMKSGETPYGEAFGLSSGFYKYSPIAAYLFYPFSLVGWTFTRVVYFLAIGASMLFFLPLILRHTQAFLSGINHRLLYPLLALLLLLGGHFARELLLGNVNWLLFIGLLVVHRFRNDKPMISGLVMGLLLAFKPHFVFLLPWLVLRKEWTILLHTGLSFVALLFLPALFLGWDENLHLLSEWVSTMQMHNTALHESPNTIYYYIDHLTLDAFEGEMIVFGSLFVTAMAIFFWLMFHYRQEKSSPEKKETFMSLEFFGIAALIPNLVHTDTEHFLWSTGILALTTLLAFQEGKKVLLIVMALALVPFALNTPDLWGRDGVDFLNRTGSLGLANLALVISSILVMERFVASRLRTVTS